MSSPLLYLILFPVVGALFIMAGSPARPTALVAAGMNLLATLVLFASYRLGDGGYQFVSQTHVLPAFGINFILGADGLSLAMLLLSTLVTVCAVAVAGNPKSMTGTYYANILFISAGVVGAFASIDLFFFYMFHELALIPTFLLVGIWGTGDRQSAAWKATIYLVVGSFILLLGLIGLYLSMPQGARTFDLRQVVEAAGSGALHGSVWVYLMLVMGFGILVSLFPFHTWAPQLYASAPTPAAMLHSAVLKKFGLYGLLRLAQPVFPHAAAQCANLLLILLIGNIIYVGYVTVAQRKLNWMIGYLSVMHMGYIFLGIVSLNILGLSGAALMLFAHGLSVAALWVLCGAVRERTGTLEFSELGGLGRAVPVLGLLFGFVAMASVSLPGFASFPAELLIFFGAFARAYSQGQPAFYVAVVLSLWSVVISAVIVLRAYREIFMGPLPARWSKLAPFCGAPRVVVTILVMAMLIVGCYPAILMKYLAPSLVWP